MEINITFVLQMFNFFIVYGILRFLLFTPTVNALNQRKMEEKALEDSLISRQKQIDKASDFKNALWLSCRTYFKDKKLSEVPVINNKKITTDITVHEENTHKDSIEIIKNKLIKKVSNVGHE